MNLHTLQLLQNSAARKILSAPKLTPTIYLHKELELDSLHVRRLKHVCVMTYKILNNLAPKQLLRMFKKVSDISSRSTRSSDKALLYIDKPRLEISKRRFGYRAAIIWNTLPQEIRQAPSVEHFKSALNIYFG